MIVSMMVFMVLVTRVFIGWRYKVSLLIGVREGSIGG